VSGSRFGPLVLLPLVSFPMALPLWRRVRAGGDPRRLNAVLRGTARFSLVFSLLLAVGLAAVKSQHVVSQRVILAPCLNQLAISSAGTSSCGTESIRAIDSGLK